MVYIIHDGTKIINRIVSDNLLTMPSGQFMEEAIGVWDGYIGQAVTIDGIVPDPLPAPPTAEEIQESITNTVQAHLDTISRERNYDGILSLCSYATSSDPIFGPEGQAGVAWRDAVWSYCYQVLSDVQTEIRAQPTAEELITELPTIVWTV